MYATTLPTSNWLRRASIRLAWYRHMPASSLSCFGMRKFVITETLWSSVIFKTLMVSLHRGRFVVVHLYSNFSVDPQNFPIGANIYQKLRFFATFQAGPTFLKPEWWNLVWGCALRQAKFYKNCLKIICNGFVLFKVNSSSFAFQTHLLIVQHPTFTGTSRKWTNV